jgi:hypothetical protein
LHAAELAQGPEAAIGDDPLAAVEGETHGLDADAGEYLIKEDGAESVLVRPCPQRDGAGPLFA